MRYVIYVVQKIGHGVEEVRGWLDAEHGLTSRREDAQTFDFKEALEEAQDCQYGEYEVKKVVIQQA